MILSARAHEYVPLNYSLSKNVILDCINYKCFLVFFDGDYVEPSFPSVANDY